MYFNVKLACIAKDSVIDAFKMYILLTHWIFIKFKFKIVMIILKTIGCWT